MIKEPKNRKEMGVINDETFLRNPHMNIDTSLIKNH
jgi:hypothetical protein